MQDNSFERINNMYMYKAGDKVVHLSHGVGVITSIEHREFKPGEFTSLYVLSIEDHGAPKKIFVPVESAAQRLRPIANQIDKNKILSYLKDKTPIVDDNQTWYRKYRGYMEKIHSGDAMNIAYVVKSIISLRETKDLSFGERKLFQIAIDLLEQELDVDLEKELT